MIHFCLSLFLIVNMIVIQLCVVTSSSALAPTGSLSQQVPSGQNVCCRERILWAAKNILEPLAMIYLQLDTIISAKHWKALCRFYVCGWDNKHSGVTHPQCREHERQNIYTYKSIVIVFVILSILPPDCDFYDLTDRSLLLVIEINKWTTIELCVCVCEMAMEEYSLWQDLQVMTFSILLSLFYFFQPTSSFISTSSKAWIKALWVKPKAEQKNHNSKPIVIFRWRPLLYYDSAMNFEWISLSRLLITNLLLVLSTGIRFSILNSGRC